MKTYSEFLTEAFDLVPQSKKEIGTEARGILTSASIKLAQKLFNDLAGTADIPDPINIERMFQSGKKTGSTTYDGNIKIHDYVWPAALKWAGNRKNKAEIKGKYFIVGPTTFHWWAAWLCNDENRIVVRPNDKELNLSCNDDFWPESWIKVLFCLGRCF